MGTWGESAFDNDAALDFIEELKFGGLREIKKSINNIIKQANNTYLEYDECVKAWVACEIIALSMGHDIIQNLDDEIIELIKKISKKDEYINLSLQCIPMLINKEYSELFQLMAENESDNTVIEIFNRLLKRLTVKNKLPIKVKKAKKGDVIFYKTDADTKYSIVQIVGPDDLIVYEGSYDITDDYNQVINDAKGRQIHTFTNAIFKDGILKENRPIRKDLKSKKVFAIESCKLFEYCITTNKKGCFENVPYSEAIKYENRLYTLPFEIKFIANNIDEIPRVRSRKEWESDILKKNELKWIKRREQSNPGPFGDIDRCKKMLKHMNDWGIDSHLYMCKRIANGVQGYGKPNEDSERIPYWAMGLLAIWIGKLDKKYWPEKELGLIPLAPDNEAIQIGLESSKYILNEIITPDAELRFIWELSDYNGMNLIDWVEMLKDMLIKI